jgi:hypothetical protein
MKSHLYDAGLDRERFAVRRWMEFSGLSLFPALGITGGWWSGLFLSRRKVFGEAIEGDVDRTKAT